MYRTVDVIINCVRERESEKERESQRERKGEREEDR